MIRSMTGFGSASTDVDGAHYLIEIRSLNNKYFKCQLRLPEELQGLEAELETRVSRRLNRGTVVVTVKYSDTSASAASQINSNALRRYFDQLLSVEGIEHNAARIDLGSLLALPGVLVSDTGEQRMEQARTALMKLLDVSCDRVLDMRAREGRVVHDDLRTHCAAIAEHLLVIQQRVPKVLEMYQDRLRQRMSALLKESGAAVREEDVLREVAVYAERSDIAEEVSRLQGHLAQFAELIDSETDDPVGRTLDFLSQEMLREANTIASKCLDVDVSRRIVEIKSTIDRIKEQSHNVE
jgi:uncharacterized protein (TIGR00255 family)